MARRARNDAPDTWHHVMNRGIARRTIFETDSDLRFFLALLAQEVRAGRLEIHAFSLLLTHFHLLVRSPKGELSEAMRRIQYRYSRRFNRTRGRDGPLFRGRFLSRGIDSLRYRRNVVTYIHDNPVAAGVVANQTDDEWSSARLYAGAERPRWLTTVWVDGELDRRGGEGGRGAQLASAFPCRVDADFRAFVEGQLHARPIHDEDVALKHAGSPKVVRWVTRNSELADGTRPWRPIQMAATVDRRIAAAKSAIGRLLGYFASRTKDAWVALRSGLLRALSGCSHREIGMRANRHASTASRDVRDHLRLMRTSETYGRIASRLVAGLLAAP